MCIVHANEFRSEGMAQCQVLRNAIRGSRPTAGRWIREKALAPEHPNVARIDRRRCARGQPDFLALLHRRHVPVCVYAFDLLELQGRDLRDLPLEQQRARLRALLSRTRATSCASALPC